MTLKSTIFLCAAVVLGLTGALVAAASGHQAFGVAFVSFFALVFVLPVSLVALAIVLLVRSQARRVVAVLVAWCALLALTLPANMAGSAIADWRFERAKQLGVEVARTLDEYRARFGRYPDTLEDVRAAGYDVRVPPFVREPGAGAGAESWCRFYVVHDAGAAFTLRLWHPRGLLFADYVYTSERREWFKED
jgi:hypothetical protein